MGNWFEDHPVRSIVGHTLLVAAATGAAFIFVFDSNKVDAAKAETEHHKAKIGALEAEIAELRGDNAKYLEWLTDTPNTIPYFDKKISDLDKENQELRARAGVREIRPNISTVEGRGATLSIGETFVDEITGFTLGLLDVNQGFTADVLLVFPNGDRREVKDAKAGDRWEFDFKNVSYQAQIRNINWYSNKMTVAMREVTTER